MTNIIIKSILLAAVVSLLPTFGMEEEKPVFPPSHPGQKLKETHFVKGAFQRAYTDEKAVTYAIKAFKRLMPNSQFVESNFELPDDFEIAEPIHFVKDGEAKASSNASLYTKNIRECCVVSLYDHKTSVAVLLHLKPLSCESVSKIINGLLGKIESRGGVALKRETCTVSVVCSYLSQHVYNVCQLLCSRDLEPHLLSHYPSVVFFDPPWPHQKETRAYHLPVYNSPPYPRRVLIDGKTGKLFMPTKKPKFHVTEAAILDTCILSNDTE